MVEYLPERLHYWAVRSAIPELSQLYLLSPLDLIPDAIPLLGLVDDVVLLPLAIRFVLKKLPSRVREDIEGRTVAR